MGASQGSTRVTVPGGSIHDTALKYASGLVMQSYGSHARNHPKSGLGW
jgi:hypothetical protein